MLARFVPFVAILSSACASSQPSGTDPARPDPARAERLVPTGVVLAAEAHLTLQVPLAALAALKRGSKLTVELTGDKPLAVECDLPKSTAHPVRGRRG